MSCHRVKPCSSEPITCFCLWIPEVLPEPKKMRPTEAAEHGKLSDFQQELVQLGATLNGDCTKDIYPHKLVEGMTVAEGARYVSDAFKTFLEECENCRKKGEGDSHFVVVKPAVEPVVQKKKSFARKMFACLVCNHS